MKLSIASLSRPLLGAALCRPRHLRTAVLTAAIGVACFAVMAGFAGRADAINVIPPGEPGGFVADLSTTQAGAHPDQTTSFTITPLSTFEEIAKEGAPLRSTIVDLSPGLTGNPEVAAKCSTAQLAAGSSAATCPQASQVGVADVSAGIAPGIFFPLGTVGVYAMETSPDKLANLAFNVIGSVVNLSASVRPEDHALRLTTRNIFQLFPVSSVNVTVWGVPADPSHDIQRCAVLSSVTKECDGSGGGLPDTSMPHSAGIPRAAFLTNPTVCDGPKRTTISVDSWQEPGIFSSQTAISPTPTGCEKLSFEPSIDVRPDETKPDAPTGLSFELTIPQSDNPDGLATAHLRDATVTLPEGMTISPSSADGLAGCSDQQIGIATAAPASCPDASKIGTVVAETPLLAEPLDGSIYVGTQESDDPESGRLFRIFLELRGPGGLVVKLPGRVRVNSSTGRIETSFVDNPQLPVAKISLQFRTGARAPLATPPTCGPKTVTAELSSWGGQTASLSDTFTIDCPGQGGFAPAFAAGTMNPLGGAFSPFALRIERPDRQQFLANVSVNMPSGMLAKLKDVPLCDDARASAGTCGLEFRIGTTTVGAGPGSNPFFLGGNVYLTGPYKGGPYGLSVAVRAVAGPFDLGMVVVRQAIHVDPEDAHISVLSDPLPTILKGVPLRLRSVNVDIDRSSFTMNPTSCAETSIGATLTADDGSTIGRSARFQAAECRALPFKPKLALRLTGRRQTRDGRHPGLRAVLTQGAGQANLKSVAVRLPLSLALDPDNARELCEFEDGQRVDCPASSIIGRARAVTPLLDEPLTGPVYFVKGVRIDRRTGREIRTLPTLLIPLRGNNIAIDLRATSSVRKGKLVNTFRTVPDAPVERFALRLRGGKGGILVVTGDRNLCRGRHVARAAFRGHNGKRRDPKVRMRTPCAKRGGKAKAKRNTAAKRNAAVRRRD